MKNKLFLMGMVSLLLAIVLMGCDEATQIEGDVGIKTTKAAQVAKVDADLTTNKTYIIVKFDAVANASSYELYVGQDGKKTIESSSSHDSSPSWEYTFADADGSYTLNTDIDKFATRIPVTMFPVQTAGTKYKFGISTLPFGNSVSAVASDIVWSDWVEL
jgi:hypothetical protein